MSFKIVKDVPANVTGNGQVEMGGFHNCALFPTSCVTNHAVTFAQHLQAALHFVTFHLFG